MSDPLLLCEDLHVRFKRGRDPEVHAVRGVSLSVRPGETLGLVGESGCGKTTLSRALLGLVPCTGSIRLQGVPLDWSQDGGRLRPRIQLIFQDPYASLNPRLTVGQTLEEPLRVHTDMDREERRKAVRHIMDLTGMAEAWRNQYPHAFSGGQRQRVAIARALVLRPEFVIADEPVSALDVSIQAMILNLLSDLKAELGLTMLFISHDLAVVGHVADRVAVMRTGELVEEGTTLKILKEPDHPYTRELLRAMPRLRAARKG